MTVVHFATELSGGAGGFVRCLHIAMQDLGLPSIVITRERSNLENSVTIKPQTRVARSLRARSLMILDKLGLNRSPYAMFGIERCPVVLTDIQHALGPLAPIAFMFYWVSYFLDFETILELRRAYPKIPFVFVCVDDAFLTGGCHISCDCRGYQESCSDCPATSLAGIKTRIERGYRKREALISTIKPFVIYPTTSIEQRGKKSSALKNCPSSVIPLGAISSKELSIATDPAYRESRARTVKKGEVTLLIRSSSEYRKGCDLFVSAVKDMSERMPDLRSRMEVISIGDETLKNARIEKYVDHDDMGYVKREELLAIYRNIDVFIVTSREDGGPLMINECVALGVFVISTPIGVASDLIIDKQNGLIMPDVSSKAIRDTLTTFLYDYNTPSVENAGVPEIQRRRSALTFEGYIEATMKSLNLGSWGGAIAENALNM